MSDLNLTGFKKIKCDAKSQDICFIFDKLGKHIVFRSSEIYINESPLCKKWTKFPQIGEKSKFGSIFPLMCEDNQKLYALKIIPFINSKDINSPTMILDDIVKEINVQNYIYETFPGFTTCIYQVFKGINMEICFITDFLDITVARYIEDQLKNVNPNFDNIQKVILKCIYMINTLFEYDILHNDAHLNNFMINTDGDIDSIKIIDFGKTEFIKDKNIKMLEKDYKLIRSHLFDIIVETKNHLFEMLEILSIPEYPFLLEEDFAERLQIELASAPIQIDLENENEFMDFIDNDDDALLLLDKINETVTDKVINGITRNELKQFNKLKYQFFKETGLKYNLFINKAYIEPTKSKNKSRLKKRHTKNKSKK